ncbi:MAG: hypothetical protein AAGK00_04975 [Pseudomonadota bacterium]
MGRALKYLFYLVVLGFLGLVAYAMLTELPPPTKDVTIELPLPDAEGG